MTDAIQKFDPKVYVDAIRERIKGAVLDVIPPEAWDAMITKEMEDFFNDRPVASTYNSPARVDPSRFRLAIQDVIAADVKKRVVEMLNGPDWGARWMTDGSGRQIASDQVKELLVKHSGEILSAWVAQAFQQVLINMQHQR